MSTSILVDALEQIANDKYATDGIEELAREALAAHRASSLVDDEALRAKVGQFIAQRGGDSTPSLLIDQLMYLFSEHLGRGQR